jgi:uncharacterized protein (TIGR02444 family)
MNEAAAAEGFWHFSLTAYARPGVAEALIGLQDRLGHNVYLMLFGLWLGRCEGRRLDAAALKRAQAAMAPIHDAVVAPLRRLRRQLKDNPDPDIQALRRRVMALELAAERRVQVRLAASLGRRRRAPSGDRSAIAEANLRRILAADFAAPEAVALRRALTELFESQRLIASR